MASQITACQRRKQFITPLKGAGLHWLFVLVCSLQNDAGASGSFFPSFFRDFTLLFWLYILNFFLLAAQGREGLALGPSTVVALSPLSLLLMERGTLCTNCLSPIKASATTTTEPGWAATQSHFLSRLLTARLQESCQAHRLGKPAAPVLACHLRHN